MKKILPVREIKTVTKYIHSKNKTIVLTGGGFDILHIGHVLFLEAAKKKGDVLFVLLESDETMKRIKGKTRPIHTQEQRAKVLASLDSVDYVVCLPSLKKDSEYDILVCEIKPDVIATTHPDPNIVHKLRQAKKNGGRVIEVIDRIKEASTTRLAKILENEL